jgi:hypothetical protein
MVVQQFGPQFLRRHRLVWLEVLGAYPLVVANHGRASTGRKRRDASEPATPISVAACRSVSLVPPVREFDPARP